MVDLNRLGGQEFTRGHIHTTISPSPPCPSPCLSDGLPGADSFVVAAGRSLGTLLVSTVTALSGGTDHRRPSGAGRFGSLPDDTTIQPFASLGCGAGKPVHRSRDSEDPSFEMLETATSDDCLLLFSGTPRKLKGPRLTTNPRFLRVSNGSDAEPTASGIGKEAGPEKRPNPCQ